MYKLRLLVHIDYASAYSWDVRLELLLFMVDILYNRTDVSTSRAVMQIHTIIGCNMAAYIVGNWLYFYLFFFLF